MALTTITACSDQRKAAATPKRSRYRMLYRAEAFILSELTAMAETGQLAVRRSNNGETRHIPLDDGAIVAFRTLESSRNDSPWVFLNWGGARLHSPRFWFGAAIENSSLKDFTWHCIRHTFASRSVMAGVDLRTVQELMGHKTIQMRVRYAPPCPTPLSRSSAEAMRY